MPALRIEGYVIVSADGMLANADHVMPDELKFAGDKAFFSGALDGADLIVHGRHSHEEQPNSPLRKRIIVTRSAAALAPDSTHPGAPAVFGMFMDHYDTFWLSQAPHVRLPGGEACFPGVPERTPQAILAAHGLKAGDAQMLEPAADVTVTPWRRATGGA